MRAADGLCEGMVRTAAGEDGGSWRLVTRQASALSSGSDADAHAAETDGEEGKRGD